MKITPYWHGVTVTLVIATGPVSICNGKPQLHGHQHANTIVRLVEKPAVVRLVEKPAASSGGSFLQTAVSLGVLPTLTKTPIGTGFHNDLPYATSNAKILRNVEPGPQAEVKPPQLQNQMAVLPSRRRFRAYSTHPLNDGLAIGAEQASSSDDIVLAASSFPGPYAASFSPSNQPKDVEGALKGVSSNKAAYQQHPVYGSPESHPVKLIYPRQDNGYQSFVLGGFSTTTTSASVSSATATSVCPGSNGTTYTSTAGINYQIICDVDYPDNDHPFELVDSFGGCVQKCDAYNYDHHHVQCLAALFVPSREGDANDCYLKSSIENPVSGALPIQGAIRLGYATASTSSSASASATALNESGNSQANSPSTASSTSITQTSTSSTSYATPPSESIVSAPGIAYASGSSVITPKIVQSRLQGPTENTPTKQYLDIVEPASITLPNNLLTVGVNSDITTGYGLSPDTGSLEINSSTQSYLSPLTEIPHLSRDGGKGGILNGEHLFIFCDTGSYSTTTSTKNGSFLGFVSSSVAIDVGMNGLQGDALSLEDGIGEWSDNAGRMRGFAPLTEGELAYNLAMQGQGHRYAIWPESSIIPLDATTGLVYAPIVYDNVDMDTKAAVFTYTGSTLLTITAGGKGGPVAQRPVDKIFDQDEVEWGCIGGIRSWGPSGIGADDGYVYLFGNTAGGILLARVAPANVSDKNSFEYWDGNAWTTDMQTSSSTAYFIEGAFMDVDVFYSPRHLTFVIVYMTIYADNTFYYRYLEADQAIFPPFAPGGDSSSDYVENILKYSWSEEQVLYKASPGLSGKYIYSGAVHLGYYGSNDILNGGSKMLLSWTAPTGLDPSTLTSEYQIPTAEITWA